MKIAILGIGRLGSGFAEACCAKGLDLIVWNRSGEKAHPFSEKGARAAESAAMAIASADVIVSTLFGADVTMSVLGGDAEKRALSGKTVISFTSTSSVEAKRLDAFVKEAGGAACLDASTVSWPAEIAQGKGTIFLSGSTDDAARWTSFLETFGTVTHLGSTGGASAVELSFLMQVCMQQHVHLSGCALMQRHGLPIDPLAKVADGNSLFASPLFSVYSRFARSRMYTPPLMTAVLYAHLIDIFIEELEAVGMDAGVWRPVQKAVKEAVTLHGPDMDWTSVYERLR